MNLPRLFKDRCSPPDERPSLHVLIFHDDTITRDYAEEFIQQITESLDNTVAIRHELWDIGSLECDGAMELIAEAAPRAHVTAFILSRPDCLPARLLQQMKEWKLPSNLLPRALVLMHPDPVKSLPWEPVSEYLEAIADQRQMNFFALSVESLQELSQIKPAPVAQAHSHSRALLPGNGLPRIKKAS